MSFLVEYIMSDHSALCFLDRGKRLLGHSRHVTHGYHFWIWRPVLCYEEEPSGRDVLLGRLSWAFGSNYTLQETERKRYHACECVYGRGSVGGLCVFVCVFIYRTVLFQITGCLFVDIYSISLTP